MKNVLLYPFIIDDNLKFSKSQNYLKHIARKWQNHETQI